MQQRCVLESECAFIHGFGFGADADSFGQRKGAAIVGAEVSCTCFSLEWRTLRWENH